MKTYNQLLREVEQLRKRPEPAAAFEDIQKRVQALSDIVKDFDLSLSDIVTDLQNNIDEYAGMLSEVDDWHAQLERAVEVVLGLECMDEPYELTEVRRLMRRLGDEIEHVRDQRKDILTIADKLPEEVSEVSTRIIDRMKEEVNRESDVLAGHDSESGAQRAASGSRSQPGAGTALPEVEAARSGDASGVPPGVRGPDGS